MTNIGGFLTELSATDIVDWDAAIVGHTEEEGIVLKSPNGTKWKLEITNDGALTQTVIPE